MLIERLPYAYLTKPCRHIERRARLAGIQVMVTNDAYLWKTAMEILHITFQGLALCRRACVFRAHGAVASAHIHDVTAHTVVPLSLIHISEPTRRS